MRSIHFLAPNTLTKKRNLPIIQLVDSVPLAFGILFELTKKDPLKKLNFNGKTESLVEAQENSRNQEEAEE